MTSIRIRGAFLVLAVIVGCGGRASVGVDDAGTDPMDAAPRDASAELDGGPTPDGGSPDAAVHNDAWIDQADAWTEADSGSEADAFCVAPRCPPIPVGCDTVDRGPCVCPEIVCPMTACSPDCAADQYCHYPHSFCGGEGTCEVRPEICISIYRPVCGCDGVTYSNSCVAAAAGQSIRFDGECGAADDCRRTMCPMGQTCEPCEGPEGVVYVCIEVGSAC